MRGCFARRDSLKSSLAQALVSSYRNKECENDEPNE
jgi:hypothetical protein